MFHFVRVHPIPAWVPVERLLGEGEWRVEDSEDGRVAEGRLPTDDAADVAARLRNVALGGTPLRVEVRPPLKRRKKREALTRDARRRRDTTPGFTRRGARLDDEGRVSLTPESLAAALGRRFAGARVVDAGCGAGGNAIGFARAGCEVVAIERDADRLADARHNAGLYGVDDRIEFVHGDAAREAAARRADLLFCDPPWGTDWSRERTTVDEFPLLAPLLAAFAAGNYGRFAAKLPASFDAEAGGGTLSAWFGEAGGDRNRIKFVLWELP